MNKRQYKKAKKKFFEKRYYSVREHIITNFLNKKYPNEKNCICYYIIDSKSGNLKHPQSINILSNVTPVSISSPEEPEDIEITLEFSCNNLAESKVPDSMVQYYLDKWKSGIIESKTN